MTDILEEVTNYKWEHEPDEFASAEKVKALIQKATNNDWQRTANFTRDYEIPLVLEDVSIWKKDATVSTVIWRATDGTGQRVSEAVRDVLFSHDFAKALWDDGWQYHLQQMVVADDPIDYAYKSVFPD